MHMLWSKYNTTEPKQLSWYGLIYYLLKTRMISMTITLILHKGSNHTIVSKLKYSLPVCDMIVYNNM